MRKSLGQEDFGNLRWKDLQTNRNIQIGIMWFRKKFKQGILDTSGAMCEAIL